MNLRPKLLIAGGFALAVAILGLIGLTTYRSTLGLMRATEMVSPTHGMMENLEAPRLDLSETESALRAYALSGDESSLILYDRAETGHVSHIGNLRRLALNDREQQARPQGGFP